MIALTSVILFENARNKGEEETRRSSEDGGAQDGGREKQEPIVESWRQSAADSYNSSCLQRPQAGLEYPTFSSQDKVIATPLQRQECKTGDIRNHQLTAQSYLPGWGIEVSA